MASSTIPENVSKDFTIAPVDDRTATYVNIRAHRDDRVTPFPRRLYQRWTSFITPSLDEIYFISASTNLAARSCAREKAKTRSKKMEKESERFRFILCCGVKWSIGTSSRGEEIEIKVDR